MDHPRAGGEKPSMSMWFCRGSGSPPHRRGKEVSSSEDAKKLRITPAWAGKSLLLLALSHGFRDHPRVGGEKVYITRRPPVTLGSPPRGRGKVDTADWAERLARITPAWAGKRLKRFHRSGIFISGPIPFHSVLHRPAGSGSSRAGRDGSPAGQPQNAGPA